MRGPIEESEELSHRETLQVVLRAIRYVGPFKRQFAVKAGLLMISLLPMLILPWPIKILIDHVIEEIPIGEATRPYPAFLQPLIHALEGATTTEILLWTVGFQLLLFVLIGQFGTTGGERDTADARLASGHDTATRTENEANEGWSFSGGLFGLFDFRWTMRLTQALNHHYRSRLFERIQSLPMTAFDDERIGDAVYRVMYDTPAITNACYRILLTPLAGPINILLAVLIIGLVFGDQPVLIWSGLSFLPIALVSTFPLARAMRRRSGQSRRAGATTTSTAEEGLSNILAVQSLGGEDRQRERFDRDSWTSFVRYRAVFLMGIAAFLVAAVPGLFVGTYTFLHITDLVVAGELTRGDFALLFTYYMRIVFLSVDIGSLWFRVQENAAGLHRVFFLMDLPGEQDPPGAAPLAPVRRGVHIENVDFDYPDGTRALTGVNLDARLGRMVALVGPAGAGKTTLAYLIPRFVSPSAGRICIDGVDIAGVTADSLRSQVAFVFQETVLFDATVEENIRIGKPDASDTQVHRAARLAGADEFIQRLPQGYATPLGRAGGKLSVGQKQRLSIARALVREAPILILDEPTSALDPETERSLVETLRETSRDHLVMVIAHRLSTVRAADQILFVDDGRIVESGSHDELMARPESAYRRFIDMQTRGAA
ncbi:MAG: ABC transporter ATP-binding protein [Proteobacteria bacterium]|nr:ABC transporter ATP-binding protein [Pseudomonadota bacterium]